MALSRQMRSVWPTWDRADDSPVTWVEVCGYAHDFPFELLTVFDLAKVEPFDNLLDAEHALRRFLGFAAGVRR